MCYGRICGGASTKDGTRKRRWNGRFETFARNCHRRTSRYYKDTKDGTAPIPVRRPLGPGGRARDVRKPLGPWPGSRGAAAGDLVTVTLELDDGYRQVDIPEGLKAALKTNNLSEKFHDLNYSTRKEFARLVAEAKAEDTRDRRIQKIIAQLQS